jgi:CXXX repeat peptide maturase
MTPSPPARADAWNRVGLDLQQLIVLTDAAAVSFCHYRNRGARPTAASRMPLRRLSRVVALANKRKLQLQFVLGAEPLPAAHERQIDQAPHVKIAPLALARRYRDAVIVLDGNDLARPDAIRQARARNLIVRLEKSQISHAADLLIPYLNAARRINVVPLDVEQYGHADVEEYRRQLQALETPVAAACAAGDAAELNVLSDRLSLGRMNNCGAGVHHLTCAPDGQLYICPGFCYGDKSAAVGNVEEGFEIRNAQLLGLDHAPICRTCDAFHCKRCVYLNAKATRELNTPSWQQCVLAHHERNASRSLRDALARLGVDVSRLMTPPELPYLDPLTALPGAAAAPRVRAAAAPAPPPSDREILLKILKVQEEILAELKKKKGDRS